MRVFLAGATGVLGRATRRLLLAAGHELVGLTRSPEKARALAAEGVEPSLADALDAPALRAAVLAARPDAVVHLLSALADLPLRRAGDLARTNLLRTSGTRWLLDAATAAGARRLVAASFVLAYGPGDHGEAPLEEDALRPDTAERGELREAVLALRALERTVAGAARDFRVHGVVLRLGFLYGPRASAAAVDALRRGALPAISGPPGRFPLLHEEDAAAAIAAALERGASGAVYNVADAAPADLGALHAALAAAAGARPPRSVPAWLARGLAPLPVAMAGTRLSVSTDAARRDLGWAPRHASFREALTPAPASPPGSPLRPG